MNLAVTERPEVPPTVLGGTEVCHWCGEGRGSLDDDDEGDAAGSDWPDADASSSSSAACLTCAALAREWRALRRKMRQKEQELRMRRRLKGGRGSPHHEEVKAEKMTPSSVLDTKAAVVDEPAKPKSELGLELAVARLAGHLRPEEPDQDAAKADPHLQPLAPCSLGNEGDCRMEQQQQQQQTSLVADPNRKLYEMSRLQFAEANLCEFCCRAFDSAEGALAHVKKLHPAASLQRQQASPSSRRQRPYSCPVCDQTFKTFHTRNNHCLSLHATDAPYACKLCAGRRRFRLASKLAEHAKRCGGSHAIGGDADGGDAPIGRLKCGECPKTLISKRNLRDHLYVVHGKGEAARASFPCPHCPGRTFFKRSNLKSHLLKHSQDKPFVCPVDGCGVRFKREKAMRQHRAELHGSDKSGGGSGDGGGGRAAGPRYLCNECGQSFKSYTGLKLHTGKLHGGEEYSKRKYACPFCRKCFRCPADLKIHSVVHSKEKPFACDICKMGFTQRASLKDHLNVHLQKYQCPACKKSFGRQRYMEKHVKSCCGADDDDDEGLGVVGGGGAVNKIHLDRDRAVVAVSLQASAPVPAGEEAVVTTTRLAAAATTATVEILQEFVGEAQSYQIIDGDPHHLQPLPTQVESLPEGVSVQVVGPPEGLVSAPAGRVLQAANGALAQASPAGTEEAQQLMQYASYEVA